MDRRLVLTAAAIIFVTIGTIAVVNRTSLPETVPLQEPVPGVSLPAEEPSAPPDAASAEDYSYIIREYEGRVAVYSRENESEPEMVLDTLVKFLPDYDRSQLQEGIRVKDYPELVSLIEDFVS